MIQQDIIHEIIGVHINSIFILHHLIQIDIYFFYIKLPNSPDTAVVPALM